MKRYVKVTFKKDILRTKYQDNKMYIPGTKINVTFYKTCLFRTKHKDNSFTKGYLSETKH